jgi:membrane protein
MVEWLKRQGEHLVATYHNWSEHDGSTMAAAVAYYVGLSFFPLLLILISGLGLFMRFTLSGHDAEQAVLLFVKNDISPSARSAVEQALEQVQSRAAVHGPAALVVMLYSSIAGFVQLQRAFDRIAGVPDQPGKGILASIRMVLVERWVAFVMLLALGLLITAVFVGTLVLYALEQYTEKVFPGSWRPIQIIVSFCVNAALFTLVYRWLPKVRAPLGCSFRGGMLAAVTWEIGRLVLAKFLIGSKYTIAYGVVGSFLGLLLWCYYGMAVLLLGAEYIQVVWRAGGGKGGSAAVTAPSHLEDVQPPG